MKPFAVGDRVKYYSVKGCGKGRVYQRETTDSFGNDYVIIDTQYGDRMPFHPKQCRRLKPPKKETHGDRIAANSVAVGSSAVLTFSMDPCIPEDEIHLRLNGKTVAQIINIGPLGHAKESNDK